MTPAIFRHHVDPGLELELKSEPGWMYAWKLPGHRRPTLLSPELDSVHTTRAEMIEPSIRSALARSSQATAVDLACSEGWFAHRLLDWGARRVLGLDVRRQNIHRANLMRDHFKIPAERLVFREMNVYDLPFAADEKFDVVLLLGLVYHLEDPVGAFRRARALSRGVVVVESQLTRQADPITHGWGSSDSAEHAAGSFATRVELDSGVNPIASAGGVLSLIPNRAAMEQMALVAGFSRTEFLAPESHHNPQYVRGDRAIMLAWE